MTRLVLVPGLATDARVFHPQSAAFPHLEVPVWREPRRDESLRDYAARLAAGIRPDGPIVLGGLSIGGMIALEMARHLPVRRVVLIASCRHPRAVNRPLRAAERITRPWPTAWYRPLLPLAPLVVGRGGSIRREDRRLLGRMAQEVPLDIIRWGARALLQWPGVERLSVPVSHIHGGRDWVIPARGVSPDVVVPCGSHVLTLSHPREVNEFLRVCFDR